MVASTIKKLSVLEEKKSSIGHSADMFNWPIITEEDEKAVLEVLRKPNFADSVTVSAFEKEYASWNGAEYAIAHSNGTSAIMTAMFACGIGRGDEVIAPSFTYWATILQCFNLGATMVFADIDPVTLCISPEDIESKITERTKAIVVVHFCGYPCDMDEICEIAKKHNIKVIEDASHAHGTLYKGNKVGVLGDIGAFSMCGKPIALGEGGMLITQDKELYERSIAWCDKFRFHSKNVSDIQLLKFSGLPMGSCTTRMHNLSAAVGRVQLRHYDERIEEVDKAMNYFWDLLEDIPGIIAHRPPKDSESTMGGWYCPHAIYDPECFEGLSVSRFAEAVRAEGFHTCTRSCVKEPLHTHPLVNECDIFNDGKPTRIAFSNRDVRQRKGSLPVTENVKTMTLPPFRKYDKTVIEQYAEMYHNIASQYKNLIPGDLGDVAIQINERGDG